MSFTGNFVRKLFAPDTSINQYLLCRQSPIDIPKSHFTITTNPGFLNIQYLLESLELEKTESHSNIYFNVIKGTDYKTLFNGYNFTLSQVHFHKKSEHTVEGKQYDMEAHLVHKSEDKDEYLVVAFFIDSSELNDVGIFDELINQDESPTLKLPTLQDELFYFYPGSLTTPDYETDVSWIVFKTPVKSSAIDNWHSKYGSNRELQTTVHPAEIFTYKYNN